MFKKIGATLGVLVFIAVGLVQCAGQDIFVVDKETGKSRTLLESWLIEVAPVVAALPYIADGRGHYDNNDFQKALTSFSEAIEIDPTSADAHLGLGYTYQALNQDRRAIEEFTQAITLNPRLADAYIGRGGSRYVLNEEFNDVFMDYDAAVKLEPTRGRPYANRGFIYAEMGILDLALKDFNTAIELDPDRPENYRERAYIYAQLELLESAIQDFERYLNLEPQSRYKEDILNTIQILK